MSVKEYVTPYKNRIHLSSSFLKILKNHPKITTHFSHPLLKDTERTATFTGMHYLFHELLSRSPYLFNFLECETLEFSEVFTNISLDIQNHNNPEKHFTIEYEHLSNKLIITFSSELVKHASAFILKRHNYYRDIAINDLSRGHEDFYDIYTKPYNEKDRSRNTNISDFLKNITTSGTFTLDYNLREMPKFEKLSQTVIKRIIGGEFLTRQPDAEVAKTSIENLIEKSLEEELKSLDQKIESQMLTISELNQRIEIIRLEAIKLIEQRTARAMSPNDYSYEKLTRLLEGPMIESYTVYSKSLNLLVITTKPIVLNFNSDKINAIRSKSLKEKLQKGYKLGIGRHKIEINLRNLNLVFKPLDGRLNYHIESYTCYGTFGEAIRDAQAQKNLPKIIALSVQMLAQATIGDPAGDATINSAYLINTDNMIEETKDRVISIQQYLNENDIINRLGVDLYAN